MRASHFKSAHWIPPLLVLVTGLLIYGITHADPDIIGEGAVKYKEWQYPALCQIRVELRRESKTMACSGTLVGPSEIASGGHCFGKDFDLRYNDVTARCGGVSVRVKSVELPPDHLWTDDDKPFSAYDYARIKIRESLPGYMTKATGPARYFETNGQLKAGTRCWIAGFGNSRSTRYGALYVAEVTRQSLTLGAGVVIMRNPTGQPLKITTDHGDSGGALFCAAPGTPAEHIAVIVGYRSEIGYDRNRMENLFATIWSQILYQ